MPCFFGCALIRIITHLMMQLDDITGIYIHVCLKRLPKLLCTYFFLPLSIRSNVISVLYILMAQQVVSSVVRAVRSNRKFTPQRAAIKLVRASVSSCIIIFQN